MSRADAIAGRALGHLKAKRVPSWLAGMDDDQLRRMLKEKRDDVEDYIDEYYYGEHEDDEYTAEQFRDLVQDVLKLARKRNWSDRDRAEAIDYLDDWEGHMSSVVS